MQAAVKSACRYLFNKRPMAFPFYRSLQPLWTMPMSSCRSTMPGWPLMTSAPSTFSVWWLRASSVCRVGHFGSVLPNQSGMVPGEPLGVLVKMQDCWTPPWEFSSVICNLGDSDPQPDVRAITLGRGARHSSHLSLKCSRCHIWRP